MLETFRLPRFCRLGISIGTLICVAGSMVGSALAWDVSVYIDRLEDYFYVDLFSGSHTWTTVEEGLRADSGTGNSLPNNNITQAWDGTMWPSDVMSDSETGVGVSADAVIEHYDGLTDEYWDYAEAIVFGDIPSDQSYGAAWFYDFDLTLDPGATANVFLDSGGAYGYIASEAGDDGIAFASVRIYSIDFDVDTLGGVNNPYDIDSLFLSAPPAGGLAESPFGLSHEFENLGGSPVTYHLRLQGSVTVFEPAVVPEPATLVLAGLASGAALTGRRRRKGA
ncbi:MAG: PEP-CTERM sorting domain-containing protein [Planctomycetales bacterium]|nr:PEP-CTERM sorting domain-containing protein [Planctomycetales bacterium]